MTPPELEPPLRETVPGDADSPGVFLNIPYDDAFQDLYLAYIAGVCAFSLVPKATLEIPGSERRLDRILGLMQSCRYSFHDLSRVQLADHPPQTPRFNMPFELGMAVGWARWGTAAHTWFVFESQKWRTLKSLSDLGGTDVYIHDGTPRGLFRELSNALVRTGRQITVQKMETIYMVLQQALPAILHRAGAPSPFAARVFADLVVLARLVSDDLL
jgi:hypothetical protein